MLPFLALILGYGALVLLGYGLVRRMRRRMTAWRSLARRLALPYDMPHKEISGRIAGSGVWIAERTNFKQTVTKVVVSLVSHGFSVAREGTSARIRKVLGASDVALGHDDFDLRVQVQGDEVLAAGYLSGGVRDALLQLLDVAPDAVLTKEGTVELERPGRDVDPEHLEYVVRRMVDVARAMRLREDRIAARLAHNAIDDEVPTVRRRNLDLLVRTHPDDAETRRAAEAGLVEPDTGVRIVAARAIGGSRGFVVLKPIAEQPLTTAEDGAAALEALVVGWPHADVAPVLDQVFQTGRPELQGLAVQAVGRARDTSFLDAVLGTTTHGDVPLSVAVATTLGQLGDTRAESSLLELLAEPDAAVRIAAARALAAVGTVAAVEPLLAHTHGLATPGALKETARDAIRTIQTRLGPVESGRLSLLEDAHTGGLSLAREGGGLAIADTSDEARRTRERS